MIAISINNLDISFGNSTLLDKISFSLEENDKLGVVGVNGCGKSTLFKIITGEYEPDSGNIFIAKDKTIGILTQDGAFDVSAGNTPLELMYSAFPALLAAEKRITELEYLLKQFENLSHNQLYNSYATEYSELYDKYKRNGGLEYRSRCASILMKMGFDENTMNQNVETLSGGQRTRLALCHQLCREPDILLLDEPTNHLDIETLGALESFLAAYKKCVIVISHDRYFLDRVTNKTLVIEYTRARLYNGAYTKTLKQREADRLIAEKNYKDQQKEIARQEAYIKQQRQWNRERNIIAAESRQKMLDKMIKLERPKEAPRPIKLKFEQSINSGNDVLNVKNLTMRFGTNTLFSNINFSIKRKERVFIVGPNGCGKSTLIKLILGLMEATEGSIESGYNIEIGYYDQQNQHLTPENTVLDELWNAYPNHNEVDIRNTLASFGFRSDNVFKTVSVLSGGERARLTLAKLILSKMNLLVLDEPTNHLDIDSREALEKALDGFMGTALVVSHDRYFISKLATRIIEITAKGGIIDYRVSNTGNAYDEFTEAKNAHSQISPKIENTQNAPSSNKEQYLIKKKQLADERREQTRQKRLKEEMTRLEEEIEIINHRMSGEEASNYLLIAELDKRLQECEERLLEIYEELDI